MSNLHNTGRLPLRSTMANKWKSHTVTNELFERKTRALEGSLNKLKSNMQRDQTKSTIGTQHRNRNKEMTQYTRDKPTVNLSPMKPKQLVKCGQCAKIEAKMKCLECVENYCSNCFNQFHLRGALQRHHRVPLATSPKKNPNTEKQSIENLNQNETEDLTNNKTNLLSFQQSFLQWRENNINKSQQIRQRHRLISPINHRNEYSNRLPHIESNSPRRDQYTNFNQRSRNSNITKKDQQRLNILINIRDSLSDTMNLKERMTEIDPLNDDLTTTITMENIEIITAEQISNNDPIIEEERPITHISNKSLSRPTSSSIKKDLIPSRSNSITLPQESLRSLLTTKSTDELEAIIVDSQFILSRPSLSTLEQLDSASDWQTLKSTSNNIDVQSIEIDQNKTTHFDLPLENLVDNESTIESAYQLINSLENIPQVKSAKDNSSTHVFCTNSTTTTSHRSSPFSFTNSFYKTNRINSSSSRDTNDGGFFTDVLFQQNIPTPIPLPLLPIPLPPQMLKCSASNEWKHKLENPSITEQDQTITNSISLRKSSIQNLSRTSSKHSIKCDEIHQRLKSQIDNSSRTSSSLSSSSLPVSMTSSKPGFDISESQSSTTSSRKSSSSSSTSTLKNTTSSAKKTSSSSTSKTTSSATETTKETSSSTSTSKNASSSTTTTETSSTDTTNKTSSSALTLKSTIKTLSPQQEPIIPTVIDEKKETLPSDSDKCLQKSMNSSENKSSSNVDVSESTNKLAKPNVIPSITREENITENDLQGIKKVHHRRRRIVASDESSKFRKLEFSVGDGLQWQEASAESLSSTEIIPSNQSSKVATPHSLTPSNPINTKFAEQFSKYDDDGQPSRTYQNVNDEEYFNQLRQELSSELDTRGSDEDAILNDHILRILQDVQNPFNEKDLLVINPKLCDNESVHQSSIDNKLLIHE